MVMVFTAYLPTYPLPTRFHAAYRRLYVGILGKGVPNCRYEFTHLPTRGGELGVLRVREHPLNMEAHPLTAKSTPS